MDILGLSTSPSSGGAYALILSESEGNRRLPIIIGTFEAQAIALELESIKPPRPMTHDLLKNIILSYNSEVKKVFYFKNDNRAARLESLGLLYKRLNCIWITEHIL